MSGINQIVLLLNSDHFEAAMRNLGGPNSMSAYGILKVLGSNLELFYKPTDEELMTVLLPAQFLSPSKGDFPKNQVTNPCCKHKMDFQLFFCLKDIQGDAPLILYLFVNLQ
jgi:hypothetical protein